MKRSSFVDRFKQSSFDLRARFGTPTRTLRRMTQRSPKSPMAAMRQRQAQTLPSQAQADAMASATVHPGPVDHRLG